MIEFEGLPEALPDLVDPVMLCAFEGWNDAGDAASSAVLHLEDVWAATQIAEFDPEDYYDFQVNRPECPSRTATARSPGPPPGCRWRASLSRPATSCWCTASSRRCAGAPPSPSSRRPATSASRWS